jgi:hypothetical protein
MADLPQLASRVVASLMTLVERARRFAVKVFLVALVVATASFLLGVAALDGGVRTVWIALGVAFGVLAVGWALLAWWRLRTLRRHADLLVTDVQALLARDPGVRTTVVETFEAPETDTSPRGTEVMVWSRQFGTMRGAMGDRIQDYRELPAAVTAVTTFPALVGGAILITLVFAACGLVFLLALAVSS